MCIIEILGDGARLLGGGECIPPIPPLPPLPPLPLPAPLPQGFAALTVTIKNSLHQ